MEKAYRKVLLPCLLIGIMIVPTLAYGADWYVDSGAGPGGDGTSWSQAFQSIQQAVNAAAFIWAICNAPPDTIHVREGTYRRITPINIDKYVTILGGYNYKGVRNWKSYPTIIDGQHVTRCLNITRPCILDGFIIRNGNSNLSGGGMQIDSTPVYCSMYDYYHVPKIRNCIIENNTATNLGAGAEGGGIFDDGSNMEILNCLFQGNISNEGGAIYHKYSTVTINKCVFHENRAIISGPCGGGAISGLSHNSTTGGLNYIVQ